MSKSLLEAYAGNPIIRGLVQLIPGGITSALDIAILYKVDKIKEERVNTFFDELSSGSILLTEEIISSEPFLNKFFIAARAAINTHNKQKIRMFAKLLKSSIHRPSSDDEFDEDTQILDQISVREWQALLIYAQFCDATPKDPTKNGLQTALQFWFQFAEQLKIELGIDTLETSQFMNHIERTGLYEQFVGGFMDYTGGIGYLTNRFYRLRSLLAETPDCE